MSADYTPRDGTLAALLIAHLQQQPAGHRMTTAEVVKQFKADKTSAATKLKPAITAGLLDVQRDGTQFNYGLPAPAEPADGKLLIAVYSDGDVSVGGGEPASDGSVMYTRAQIQQLVHQVTRPHVPMDTAGACA